MTWTNKDGLVQRFGVERSTSAEQGFSTRGVKNYLVVDLLDAAAIPDSLSTATPPDEDAPFIPAGSIVTNAWFVVTTDFTSDGAATFYIGLQQGDGTLIDTNAIDANIALDKLVVSSTTGAFNCDGAYVVNAGGQIHPLVDTDSYVGFSYNVAAFTAGAGKLVLEYIKYE